MAPLLSGDCAPLRDGAPYEFVRTVFYRVVTPLRKLETNQFLKAWQRFQRLKHVEDHFT